MSRLEDLAERVERLVLRHEELKRAHALLAERLDGVSAERDSLKSRLAAARARIDALLDRLPADPADAGAAEYIEDCPVCCRPILVETTILPDGVDVQVRSDTE